MKVLKGKTSGALLWTQKGGDIPDCCLQRDSDGFAETVAQRSDHFAGARDRCCMRWINFSSMTKACTWPKDGISPWLKRSGEHWNCSISCLLNFNIDGLFPAPPQTIWV